METGGLSYGKFTPELVDGLNFPSLTESMHTRPGGNKDISRLIELSKQLFYLHVRFDEEYYTLDQNADQCLDKWFQEQIAGPKKFIFVAEKETKIVGFISGYIKTLYPWFQIKSVGHISYMIVDKDYQQRDIGKLLESAALTWFKSQNVSYVELYVDEKNTIGQKAWKVYGFLPFKRFLRKRI